MQIKGAIHLHSKYSYDGQLSLLQIKELFIKEGLQFACMAEHTDDLTIEAIKELIKDCKQHSDEKFVFIPGFEIPYKGAHILMIGAREFLLEESEEINGLSLQMWRENTSLVILAHPSRNNFVIDDDVKNILDGIEVWNSYYDGKNAPRARSLLLLQELQKEKPQIRAFAGWDMHRKEHIGGPAIFINIKLLSVDAILHKLISGAYTLGKQDIIISSCGIIEKGDAIKIQYKQYKSVTKLFALNILCYINKFFIFVGLPIPEKIKKKFR